MYKHKLGKHKPPAGSPRKRGEASLVCNVRMKVYSKFIAIHCRIYFSSLMSYSLSPNILLLLNNLCHEKKKKQSERRCRKRGRSASRKGRKQEDRGETRREVMMSKRTERQKNQEEETHKKGKHSKEKE